MLYILTPRALSELDRRRQGRAQRASPRAARLTLTTWGVNYHLHTSFSNQKPITLLDPSLRKIRRIPSRAVLYRSLELSPKAIARA